jgi:hypothetical protein
MIQIDEARANHAERFFENVLVHTKGRFAGKRFLLPDWQRDGIIRPIFGQIDEIDLLANIKGGVIHVGFPGKFERDF